MDFRVSRGTGGPTLEGSWNVYGMALESAHLHATARGSAFAEIPAGDPLMTMMMYRRPGAV